jgi:hypothetical protein
MLGCEVKNGYLSALNEFDRRVVEVEIEGSLICDLVFIKHDSELGKIRPARTASAFPARSRSSIGRIG